MTIKITKEIIEAAKTSRGGWTAKTLAGWGVPWPPPPDWGQALIEGHKFQLKRKCAWCGEPFVVWGRGSNLKRFCSNTGPESCKRQFEQGCRTYVDWMMGRGLLTVKDLKFTLTLRAGK